MSGWLSALRCAYGVTLIAAPPSSLSKLSRAPIDRRTALVARVLGARELLQAALVARHPSRNAQLASAGVDGLHAATMFALAALDHSRRTVALQSGATATALAVASLAAARRSR